MEPSDAILPRISPHFLSRQVLPVLPCQASQQAVNRHRRVETRRGEARFAKAQAEAQDFQPHISLVSDRKVGFLADSWRVSTSSDVFTHNTTKLCANLEVELSADPQLAQNAIRRLRCAPCRPLKAGRMKNPIVKLLRHACRRLLCVWSPPPVRGGRDPLQGQVTAVFSGPKERARIPCALAVVPSSMCARRRRFRRTRSRQKNALCA